jgi:bacteriocin-like protein
MTNANKTKAKATTTIKSTPVERAKVSKDELSEQELNKVTGGTATTVQETTGVSDPAKVIIRAKMNN